MSELKLGQIVNIDSIKYSVINMIEFSESGWKWQEYEVASDNGQHKWLSIETGDDNNVEYWLYSKYTGYIDDSKLEFEINGTKYSLYEKGVARVDNYFGNADVDILERCTFIDYISEEKDKIISVEKWEGEIERSIGEKIVPEKIKITDEMDENVRKRYSANASTKRGIGCIMLPIMLVFIIGAITTIFKGGQKIQSYIDNSSGTYEYVTSVTNNVNNTKAKVYKCTKYSTVNEVVRDIINGVPEGIKDVKTLNDDGSSTTSLGTASISQSYTYSEEAETNGVGLTTKSEYAYVYKEDGCVYVQVSKFKYLDDGGSTYHSSRTHYYSRIYSRGISSNGYTSYSSSARQESINSRKSSGGGTSSGK